eukprot:m.221521 g.221521  ORF g.221521 m.221521 type:complete len:154 (+) comp25803_c0_seq9:103-564(+)
MRPVFGVPHNGTATATRHCAPSVGADARMLSSYRPGQCVDKETWANRLGARRNAPIYPPSTSKNQIQSIAPLRPGNRRRDAVERAREAPAERVDRRDAHCARIPGLDGVGVDEPLERALQHGVVSLDESAAGGGSARLGGPGHLPRNRPERHP